MIAYTEVETNGCFFAPVICRECNCNTGVTVPVRKLGMKVTGICITCNLEQREQYMREEAEADLL
jgi:RNase P subunit RPR2